MKQLKSLESLQNPPRVFWCIALPFRAQKRCNALWGFSPTV